MTGTHYKVLAENGRSYHGGLGSWPLPKGKQPGKWLKVDGRIVPCANGLHLCRRRDLVSWLGPAIFVAEFRGEKIAQPDKLIVREARLIGRVETWNERTARLFAADCAERALERIKRRGYTIDGRSLNAVEVARAFANGDANRDDLAAAWDAAGDAAWAAAGDAAWDAAWAAAWDAAWAAARAAAGDAAWAAAGDAAWAAAGDAAGDAARAAERRWQTNRLFEYLDGTRG